MYWRWGRIFLGKEAEIQSICTGFPAHSLAAICGQKEILLMIVIGNLWTAQVLKTYPSLYTRTTWQKALSVCLHLFILYYITCSLIFLYFFNVSLMIIISCQSATMFRCGSKVMWVNYSRSFGPTSCPVAFIQSVVPCEAQKRRDIACFKFQSRVIFNWYF